MFLPITTINLVGCLYWAYVREGRRSPLTLALAFWAVGIGLMSAPIFTFEVDYSVVADAFAAGCLFVTTAGYRAVRAKPREPPATYRDRPREVRLSKWLAAVGIVGCLLLLVDALAQGAELSVAYLLENLGSIRAAGFNSIEGSDGVTPVALAGSLLAPCSYLGVIGAARFGHAGGRSLVALGVVSFISVGLVGLFVYAGRSTLYFAALVVVISLYIGGKRLLVIRPRTLVIAGTVVASLWYFSVSFVQSRTGSFNPESLLRVTQRAGYTPWVAPLARSNDALGVSLVSLGYFASPLPTLSFYVEQAPVPGPFWGQYSFPAPTRAGVLLTGTEDSRQWSDVRRDVFAPLEGGGHQGNVYATWLRDLLVDFGYVGAIVFSGSFGAFMAWARNAFERSGALHYHWFEVLACFTLGFGAFAGVLFFTFLSTAFFVALGIAIWFSMLRPPGLGRTKRSRGANHPGRVDRRSWP